jgi:hypothetical protein
VSPQPPQGRAQVQTNCRQRSGGFIQSDRTAHGGHACALCRLRSRGRAHHRGEWEAGWAPPADPPRRRQLLQIAAAGGALSHLLSPFRVSAAGSMGAGPTCQRLGGSLGSGRPVAGRGRCIAWARVPTHPRAAPRLSGSTSVGPVVPPPGSAAGRAIGGDLGWAPPRPPLDCAAAAQPISNASESR